MRLSGSRKACNNKPPRV